MFTFSATPFRPYCRTAWPPASRGHALFRQVSLLVLIETKGGHLVGDIVHFLGVSYAAASQTVDKLVKMNLLTLESDPRDRRVKRISVTEKGARIAQQFQEEQARRVQRLIAQYEPEALKRLSRRPG
ncbi:winged helix DNA-binding protein [bacterium]|nr:winged helix DNA-binding protein [bacterium]